MATLKIKKGEIYGAKILFEDDSGETGDVILDDTSANYEYLEIFYFYNTNAYCMSEMIHQPNGKGVKLNGNYDNGTYLYMVTNDYTISGTSITLNNAIRWRIDTGGGATRTATGVENLKIYKVIGYR